jgi:hypothetical protein
MQTRLYLSIALLALVGFTPLPSQARVNCGQLNYSFLDNLNQDHQDRLKSTALQLFPGAQVVKPRVVNPEAFTKPLPAKHKNDYITGGAAALPM